MSGLLRTTMRGDTPQQLRALASALPRSVRASLRTAANGIRRELLQGVRGRGRVSAKDKAIGVAVPRLRPGRPNPAAKVFSRLMLKGGLKAGQPRAEPVDLLAVLDAAPTIKPFVNTWLAVPTPAAPRKSSGGRGRPATPSEAEYDHGIEMTFRRLSDTRALLTGKGKNRKTVYYVLIRQTQVRRKVNIDATVARWKGRLPTMITTAFERAQRRVARRYG